MRQRVQRLAGHYPTTDISAACPLATNIDTTPPTSTSDKGEHTPYLQRRIQLPPDRTNQATTPAASPERVRTSPRPADPDRLTDRDAGEPWTESAPPRNSATLRGRRRLPAHRLHHQIDVHPRSPHPRGSSPDPRGRPDHHGPTRDRPPHPRITISPKLSQLNQPMKDRGRVEH